MFGRTFVEIEREAWYDIEVEILCPLYDKTIRVENTDSFTSQGQRFVT